VPEFISTRLVWAASERFFVHTAKIPVSAAAMNLAHTPGKINMEPQSATVIT
jgi:hypothetical protein